ncbi:MAG: hypothetical protein KJP25_07930 [Gammaproteobacteria bacterium]|nr:hypothetical protein [Gammaproteobacteria bacterium]MBT8151189.1 hypothetical protein [Gammaproteobacteria bacterium]NNM11404.1 hypothetical protein [Pseudomonadales bacterium]RZV54736.1 MAG: hypothetical protein EX270_07240 [Pseudomonadales bacterium]
MLKYALRYTGILLAAPFFMWLPIGLLEAVPSIIDVFGVHNLRIPSGIAIAGLLMSAVGFEMR